MNSLLNNQESSSKTKSQKSVWTSEEEIKLIVYISENKELFAGKSIKRQQKVYKRMAQFLTTKTPTQCRSHFQYLTNQHGTHFKIKKHLREELGKDNFNILYQQFSTEIKQSKQQQEHTEPKSIGVQCEITEPAVNFICYPYMFYDNVWSWAQPSC